MAVVCVRLETAVKRVKRSLLLLTVLVTICSTISALGAAIPASATVRPLPAVAHAGQGCPAGMRYWTPRVTSVPSGDPQAVAPGALSGRAQATFGKTVARMLAGRHRAFHWLSAYGCRIVPRSSGPRAAGSPQLASAGPFATPRPVRAHHGPTLAPGSETNPQTSTNWSGYESNDGGFTGASMEWIVPGVDPSSPDGAATSVWPGIGSGGSTSDELIQAGTDTSKSGGTIAWTEVVPDEPSEVQASGFSVSAGDDVAVNATWDASTHTAAFFMVNYTTGTMTDISSPVNGSSGSQAEWIIERSEAYCTYVGKPCVYAPLNGFGAETIMNAAADKTSAGGVTTNSYVGSLNGYFPITMTPCSGSGDLADPSANVDAQGNFTDTWKSYGQYDPGNCTWQLSPGGTAVTAVMAASQQPTVLNDTTANLGITCNSPSLSGITGAAQQTGGPVKIVSISGGSLACTDTLGDGWSAKPTAQSSWTVTGDVGSPSGRTTSDIQGISLDVTGNTPGGTCSFRLSGNAAQGDAFFQDANFLSITKAELTVSQVTGAGCAAVLIANSDAAQMAGSYQFSPAVTLVPAP
jgi:hypothetical protein